MFDPCIHLILKVIYLYLYFDIKSIFFIIIYHFICFCYVVLQVCSMHKFQNLLYIFFSFYFLVKNVSISNEYHVKSLFIYLFVVMHASSSHKLHKTIKFNSAQIELLLWLWYYELIYIFHVQNLFCNTGLEWFDWWVNNNLVLISVCTMMSLFILVALCERETDLQQSCGFDWSTASVEPLISGSGLDASSELTIGLIKHKKSGRLAAFWCLALFITR